jgi:hypothetical protein
MLPIFPQVVGKFGGSPTPRIGHVSDMYRSTFGHISDNLRTQKNQTPWNLVFFDN